MCCRYVLLREHAKSLLEQLGVLLEAGSQPPPSRHNIPPGGRIPAIRNVGPTAGRASDAHARELAFLHWGLTPGWARPADAPLVNARAESLAEKPAFRDAFRARRCLVPATGFYEWKISGRAREPWLFRLRDARPFAFAALWESRPGPDGAAHESCAVVTTAPNALMEPVHHRMPVMLADATAWDAWLDPRVPPGELASLLRPLPAEAMTAVAVGPRVNSVRHDDAECLAPAAENQLSMDF